MANLESTHCELTPVRSEAFSKLFGAKPIAAYPFHRFCKNRDSYLIDVLVYPVEVEGREAGSTVAAVTNGMSDVRLWDAENPSHFVRHELIQYLPKCDESHARHIYEMAWIPLFDRFLLDVGDTVAWPTSGDMKSPWKNGFFLQPIWSSHRDFEVILEGDPTSFLWFIALSDKELAFKKREGMGALVGRMEAMNLPWIFDERDRASLL